MGIVYEALDAALGRRVAIKMMVHNPLSNPEEAKTEGDRFVREAQLAARLKHPHIVGMYEVGVIQGQRYLAMELVEGEAMCDWMIREDVTIRDEVELLRKAALAVQHAHENGVIHRDLKPANILVDTQNEPHITDFGLAKMVGQNLSVSLTGAGMVVGTPAYVSPEQAQGSKTTDGRTDVYSLGVMLFEIVTGHPPYQGETAMEILVKAAKNPVPSATNLLQVRLGPEQSKGLDDICQKALAKKPGDRYHDAAAFAGDLEKWLNGEEIKVVIPTRRAVATTPLWKRVAGVCGAVLVLIFILVQILSRPDVDHTEAERLRYVEMRLASERRAQEEKFRIEREKLAAERHAAEERAKAMARELEALKTPMLRAVDVPSAAQLKPGLIGEFYSGTNFEMLLQRRIETDLKLLWNRNANPSWPDGSIDMVSARWRGYLRVPKTASYVFQATAHEGMSLFVDDVQVVSNWMTRRPTSEIGVVVLEQGLHTVLVDLFKTNGPTGGLWVTWKRSNEPGSPDMEDSAFQHDPSAFTPVTRRPTPDIVNRKILPGAQEAETLKILESAPDATVVLPTAGRGSAFLLWGKTKLADRLVLEVDAAEAGERTLILALGRAKNGAVVRIAVNGVVLAEKVDLYHPVSHFLEHEYKRVALRKGSNELEFTIVGTNPAAAELKPATGLHKLSLDYVRIR